MVDKPFGEVAMITGGNSGIGLATAREFNINGPPALLHDGKSATYAGAQLDPKTGEIRFEFVDGTNMKPTDGHMHNVTMCIAGDRLIAKWEFFENGKLKQTESAEYTRVK